VEIKNLIRLRKPIKWGNGEIVAKFNIETKNFLIRDCSLVLAPSGRLIVQLPYRTYTYGGQLRQEAVIEFKEVDFLEAIGQDAVRVYEAAGA
jgi:hypothetical protein